MIHSHSELPADQAQAIRALVTAEESGSGRRPLDEVNRVALAGTLLPPERRDHWVDATPSGELMAYGVVDRDQVAEVSALDPDHAATLIRRIAAAYPAGFLRTHGERSAGHLAATRLHLVAEREIALLTRALPTLSPCRPVPPGITVSQFDVDRDAAEWLEVNRHAFAELPDQASWTRSDLQLRLDSDWFDAQDFLIARDAAGTLAGFHWTKVDRADIAESGGVSGEVFVLAVARGWRGTGLAGALLDEGLTHLTLRGCTAAHLFVDADNIAAVRLYERAGFRREDCDRLYRLAPNGA